MSLILSRVNSKVGRKWDIPEEKTPAHPQAELGLSHMRPEQSSNPQWWDNLRFRVLKIRSLTTGAAILNISLNTAAKRLQ